MTHFLKDEEKRPLLLKLSSSTVLERPRNPSLPPPLPPVLSPLPINGLSHHCILHREIRRYKIREILIKNQKAKSREIFRDIHWIGHHNKIPPDSWCEPSTLKTMQLASSQVASWPYSNGLFQKKTKRGGERGRRYGIFKGIKEIAKGIYKDDQE